MDPELGRVLASRLGLTPEELETIQTGEAWRVLASKYADRVSDDPLLTSLIATTFHNSAAHSNEIESQEDEERALVSAKREIRRLKESLEATIVMLNYIGDAFGACPVCFGRNTLCTNCMGDGKPGEFSIPKSEEVLIEWAASPLKYFHLRIVKEAQS